VILPQGFDAERLPHPEELPSNVNISKKGELPTAF